MHKPRTATDGINGEFVRPRATCRGRTASFRTNSYNHQPGNDYFQTGFVSTQSVTISTGNEKEPDPRFQWLRSTRSA